jgi:hypothetical protein
LDKIKDLIEDLDEKDKINEAVYESTVNPDSPYLSFVARIDDEVVGIFILAKDINLDYYKSHFHI